MIGVVKLTAEPEAIDLGGGRLVYEGACDEVPSGRGLVALMLPPVPGFGLPYALGDVLLAGIAGGTAYVLGSFASAVEHEGHTRLAARSSDKDLRLGTGWGEWETFMLYATASADLARLAARIDYVADNIAAAMDIVSPGSGAAWKVGMSAPGYIIGGDEAQGVMGRPREPGTKQ